MLSILPAAHAIQSCFHTKFGYDKKHYSHDQRTESHLYCLILISLPHALLYKYLLFHIFSRGHSSSIF